MQSTDLSCTMKRSEDGEKLVVASDDNDTAEEEISPSTMTGEKLALSQSAVSELCRSNSTMDDRSRGRCFSFFICPKTVGDEGGGAEIAVDWG